MPYTPGVDTGETHIPERPATRPVGGGPAPRNAGPEDPRTESPTKATRARPAGAAKAPRAPRAPKAKVAPVPSPVVTPETPKESGPTSATSGLIDELAFIDRESGPVEIPTIVPAEPDVPPDEHPDERPEEQATDATNQPSAVLNPVVAKRRRPRVRRVTRVVRHVDTWSVFKVALVFNVFLYGVCVTAGVLLWQVAQNTGTVDNIERFFESNGWETFELHGGEIFHNAWVAGLFVVVGFTGMAVLMATMFNLITDLVGGIRVSVLEEEVIAVEERGPRWRWPWVRTPMPDAGSPPQPDDAVAEAVQAAIDHA